MSVLKLGTEFQGQPTEAGRAPRANDQVFQKLLSFDELVLQQQQPRQPCYQVEIWSSLFGSHSGYEDQTAKCTECNNYYQQVLKVPYFEALFELYFQVPLKKQSYLRGLFC